MNPPILHAAPGAVKSPPSRTLGVLLLITGGFDVLRMFFEFRSVARLRSLAGQTVPLADVPRILPSGIALVASILGVTTVIVWLVWQYRAQGVLHALRIPGLRFTPGWAVGWWFVPFANLVMPYQVNAELWRATTPRGSGSWQGTAVDPIVPSWWGLYVVRELINITSIFVALSAATRVGNTVLERVSRLSVGREIAGVGFVASVAAAMAAYLMVSKVDARLQRLAADPPEPPRPDLMRIGPS